MRGLGFVFRFAIVLSLSWAGVPSAEASETESLRLMRSFVEKLCKKMPFWKSSLRLPNFGFSSFEVDVGQLVWACPASFRLSYAGPGAFEFASIGSESWLGRPSLSHATAQVEHHWRPDGHELQNVLAYLGGDESRLGALVTRFKIEVLKDPKAAQAGLWSVSLKPTQAKDFSALRLDWHQATGELRSVMWVSVQGLPLLLDLSSPVPLARSALEARISPRLAPGATVEKHPPLKKTKQPPQKPL